MESLSCLPSCSMIYLKHPSFGIQLKHLTTKKKKNYQTFEHEKSEMHVEYCPGSWLFLMVVSCLPCFGETKSCRRCLTILVISLA